VLRPPSNIYLLLRLMLLTLSLVHIGQHLSYVQAHERNS